MSNSGKKGVKFYINGNCHRAYQLYESFKFIPLSYMQNAIKYTTSGDVNIDIKEVGDFFEFSVESTGPLIEESELQSIFLREKRGRWAIKSSNDGMGIGLYIAKIVADIHNVAVGCESKPLRYHRDNIPQADNKFYFRLPVIGDVL